MDLKPKNRTA